MPEAGCAAPPPATTRTPPAHSRTYRPALPTTRIFPTRAEYNAVLIAALMALIDAGLGELSLSGLALGAGGLGGAIALGRRGSGAALSLKGGVTAATIDQGPATR